METFSKFICFVFLLIINQSIMIKTNWQEENISSITDEGEWLNIVIESFKAPHPMSPIIKRSIPNEPKKIEISNTIVGFFFLL